MLIVGLIGGAVAVSLGAAMYGNMSWEDGIIWALGSTIGFLIYGFIWGHI